MIDRELVDGLTGGRIIEQGGPAVRAKMKPLVVTPFGLSSDPGFRDYAFRYKVSGSETEQMVLNAKMVIEYLLQKRVRYTPPKALTAIADATGQPSAAQVETAVSFAFLNVLFREPTEQERTRYVAFTMRGIERFGNRQGLIHGLSPVLLHPESVFRVELGDDKPDEHGRLLLPPLQLAISISYALTDDRPDDILLKAARSGRLGTREDIHREVTRLLNDSKTEKPRFLRFFQEYFGYTATPDVFKDEYTLKDAGIGGKYQPIALGEPQE